jgi:hypothetical protein
MKKTLLIITLFFLALVFSKAKEFDYTKYTPFKLNMSTNQTDSVSKVKRYVVEKDSADWVITNGKSFAEIPIKGIRLFFENDSLRTIVFNFKSKKGSQQMIKLLSKTLKPHDSDGITFFMVELDESIIYEVWCFGDGSFLTYNDLIIKINNVGF